MSEVYVRPDGLLAVRNAPPSMRASGTPDGFSPIYGSGGLFGICGADPTLVNAIVGPVGYEKMLTWEGSDEQSPMFDALTYIGTSGYTQSGLCADCGKPSFKVCIQSACFGRICQQTNEHAADQVGLRRNQGIPTVALFGNITDPSGAVLIGKGQPITSAWVLDLAGAAYNLRRKVAELLWSGNPANNSGGYWEFPGFSRQISTGKEDAITEIACDGLDSYVKSYGSKVVGAVGSPSILTYIRAMVRSIWTRRDGAQFSPDGHVAELVMHPTLWEQVSRAAACEYGLTCDVGATVRQDALKLAEMWEDMLVNKWLPIDGQRVPVVTDNNMPLVKSPYGNVTKFCGTIYYITRVVDGMTVTHGQFQDFQKTAGDVIDWFRRTFGATPMVVDGGRYLVASTTSGGICFDSRVFVKPRLIVRMPYLCGKITNVCVVPEGKHYDVTGSGGTYEVGGGTSTIPYVGLYGDCGTR